MNDRHPSGAQPPTGSPADASYAYYPAYDSYAQQAPAAVAEYGDGDPLFGSLPGSYETGMYDTGTYDTGMYDTGTHAAGAYGMSVYGTGSYGTDTYDTGTHPAGDGYATGAYDTGGYAAPQWDTGAWETGGWDTGTYAAVDPHASDAGYDPYAHTTYDAPAHDATTYTTSGHETAGYDATAYGHGGYDTGSHPTGAYDTGSYATSAYDAADAFDAFDRQATALQETASYEATQIWSTTDQDLIANIPAQAGPPPTDTLQWDSATWNEAGHLSNGGPGSDRPANDPYDTGRAEADERSPGDAEDHSEAAAVADAMTQAMPITPAAPAPAGRRVAGPDAGKAVRGRGRRRTAKRSALLTVAVPSVAAMGVCAAAAAAVTDFGGTEKDEATTQAAPDAGAVKPAAANNKLDTQLAGLSASADDFRDRASRTQERIDLKERQAQERKRKAEEAARKEAARPKFLLPVKQHGLSAQFGQAGVNWMSLHTGIDFPVSYGTPVMSATDGTVRTQWNSAYGNMAIVTAPDGTETWYCHLSSTKIRSGSVKAGDQIAYSGNSGNSTGPHLHFEVRPGGGAAVDPLPWLRDHGLDPN
ncbi:M23 family metallopeptidase [Streptomyces platensis]|uniref:M23 family metallopeptidase n=1 Tax=Streptomyces platensis TaxID=58346 RepID=UPI001F390D26|nr:M23 family metallopeptidase [Streptomyces platensis]MCF3147078.1 peptidoglycan DD-metalloendopeptidase family protein [Streptomyces platensis]